MATEEDPTGESDLESSEAPAVPGAGGDSGQLRLLAAGRAFMGPLPPPEILAQYEQICPGAADRIMGLAERQSSHRQNLETKALEADITDQQAARAEARVGQIFGLVIGMTTIITGGLVAILNPTALGALGGALIGGSGVGGLVTVFIYGRRSARSSQEEGAETGKR